MDNPAIALVAALTTISKLTDTEVSYTEKTIIYANKIRTDRTIELPIGLSVLHKVGVFNTRMASENLVTLVNKLEELIEVLKEEKHERSKVSPKS